MKQSTTRLKFAWLASVSGTCHVELDELPNLNSTKEQWTSRRIRFFSFFANQMSKGLLGDLVFDQSDANQIKRKKYWRSIIKKRFFVKMGPKRCALSNNPVSWLGGYECMCRWVRVWRVLVGPTTINTTRQKQFIDKRCASSRKPYIACFSWWTADNI